MKLWIYPYPTESWENLSAFSARVYRQQAESDFTVIEVVTKDEVEKLKREIEILRHFGNRDCTAMADEAIQSMETK